MVAQELYDLGFSYRHYKEHISKGMVYYYDNNEWVIGGNANEPITDFQEKIVKMEYGCLLKIILLNGF